MKFCQAHWDQLKQAIKSRGLWDMVSESGKQAMERTVSELESGKTTMANYDPLMSAHNLIVSNALKTGGLYLMQNKPDGSEYCPVCEADAHGQTNWINLAADGQKEFAETLKQKPTTPTANDHKEKTDS